MLMASEIPILSTLQISEAQQTPYKRPMRNSLDFQRHRR